MFGPASAAFGGHHEDVLPVAEMTMATVMEDGDRVDNADFLARVDSLTALGYHVLVSDYLRYFRLRAFLRRYTQGRIGIVVRLDNLRDIFNPEFYSSLEGGILEAFGRLFCDQTSMYVYPGKAGDGSLIPPTTASRTPRCTISTATCKEHGRILALPGVNPEVVDIDWRQVLPALRADAPGWARQVPPVVAELIRLFGYPQALWSKPCRAPGVGRQPKRLAICSGAAEAFRDRHKSRQTSLQRAQRFIDQGAQWMSLRDKIRNGVRSEWFRLAGETPR